MLALMWQLVIMVIITLINILAEVQKHRSSHLDRQNVPVMVLPSTIFLWPAVSVTLFNIMFDGCCEAVWLLKGKL